MSAPLPEGRVDPIARRLAGPASRFVEARGVVTHYVEASSPHPLQSSATGALLLHPFASSVASFNAVAAPLARVFGRVVAYDRAGCGLTERPDPDSAQGREQYTYRGMVAHLHAFRAAVDLPRPVLVGSSTGGYLALAAALAALDRTGDPGFTGVVTGNAPVYRPAPGAALAAARLPGARTLMPAMLRATMGAWDGAAMQRGMRFAYAHPEAVPTQVRGAARVALCYPGWDRALWAMSRYFEDVDVAGQLHRILVPTAVVAGEHDRIVPPDQAQRLAGALPRSRLFMLPDAGHLPQEECPDRYVAAIAAFARDDL